MSSLTKNPAARTCRWCGNRLAEQLRSDAVHCSQRCRQAAHRFGRDAVARRRATDPFRLAYADPPYPGLAARYYRDHPDFGGEVDHRALLSSLQVFDGWALSTSSKALPDVLAIARELGLAVSVAAWFRGARGSRSAGPRSAWEPVVYAGGRRVVVDVATPDALVHVARPRLTDPARVVGAKPARFAFWLFDLLGALPGDELVDVFPGSGGIGRAWELYTSRAAELDALPPRSASSLFLEGGLRGELEDASPTSPADASRFPGVDASEEYSREGSRLPAPADASWAAAADALRRSSATAELAALNPRPAARSRLIGEIALVARSGWSHAPKPGNRLATLPQVVTGAPCLSSRTPPILVTPAPFGYPSRLEGRRVRGCA